MNSWLKTMRSALHGSNRPARRSWRGGRKTRSRRRLALEQLELRTLLTVETPVLSPAAAVKEGTEVTVTAEFSDPGPDSLHICEVNFGNGQSGSGIVTETVGNPTTGRCVASHLYKDDSGAGTFTVTVTVRSQNFFESNSTTLDVDNEAPVLQVPRALDDQVEEGKPVTISASFSDAGFDQHECLRVDFGDGRATSDAASETLGNPTLGMCSAFHTYEDNGSVTVDVTVTDDDGAMDRKTSILEIINKPPVVEPPTFSPNAIVDEGMEVTVTAAFRDPGKDTHTCEMDFGDGQKAAGTVTETPGNPTTGTCSATHTYRDDFGTTPASVSVTVMDDEGDKHTNFGNLQVENVPASALDLTLDSDLIFEGGTARIIGTFADPGILDRYLVLIEWGPDEETTGIQLPTGEFIFSASHKYRDDNPSDTPSDPYTITVTLTDVKDGLSTTGTIDLTVNNEIPDIDSLEPEMINEGNPFTLPAMPFTDKGTQDTHTATIDWGDDKSDPGTIAEAAGSGTVTGSHEYDDNGTHNVVVCVMDDDTGEDCGSLTVTVNNVPPVVSTGDDVEIAEGATIDIAGSFTDPGQKDTWVATVDFGDGDGSQTLMLNPEKTFNLSHRYADNGEFTVTVTVTDDDGGFHSDSLIVRVTNVGPMVFAGDRAVILSNGLMATSGFFTDPGMDTWSLTVDYGDGSGVQPLSRNADNSFELSHTYPDEAEFTVTVTVTDDDGGVGDDSLLTVRPKDFDPVKFPPLLPYNVRVVEDLTGDGLTPDDPFATGWMLDVQSTVTNSTYVPTFSVAEVNTRFGGGNGFLFGMTILSINSTGDFLHFVGQDRFFNHYDFTVRSQPNIYYVRGPDGFCGPTTVNVTRSRSLLPNGSIVADSAVLAGCISHIDFINLSPPGAEPRYLRIPVPAASQVTTQAQPFPTPPAGEFWTNGEVVVGTRVGPSSEFSGICDSRFQRAIQDCLQTISAFHLTEVSGIVFEDHNGNGVRDPEDQPIADVDVVTGPGGGVPPRTDQAGAFKVGVSPAVITELLPFPPGLSFLDVATTTDAVLRFPTTRSGQTATRDLGVFFPAPLSGMIYEDHNGNGVRDAEDQPYSRIPLVVAPDTNGDGLYGAIGDCAQSNYCTPSGYRPTNELGEYSTVGPGKFGVSIPDDPDGNSILTVTDGRSGVIARSGEEIEDANFGVFEHVFAIGQVFEDRDDSGQLDSHDDRLLNDVTVGLDLDDDGSIDETVMTDDLGVYTFANIPPGTHRVRPLLKPGAVQILPADQDGMLMPILITPRSGEPIDLPLIGVNLGNDIAVTAATRPEATRVTFDFTTDGRPEPFQAGLYQSANDTFDTAAGVDVRVGNLIQLTPARGGGAQQGSFTLPRNFQRDPQRPRLIVVADPARRVAEVDEANNTIVVEATADIAITSAKRENNATFPNSPQIVTVMYGLAGNPGPFDLALYRSADTRFGPGDLLLDGTVRRITPPPGATSGGEIFNIGQYRPDPALPFLLVAVDRDNLVDETNETNNAARVERVIDLAPLQVEGNFLYNEPQDRFEALGNVRIGFKPGEVEVFYPLVGVNGAVNYDDANIRANGAVSAFISQVPVEFFTGSATVEVASQAVTQLNVTTPAFDLAGIQFTPSRIAFVNPGGGATSDSVLEVQGTLTFQRNSVFGPLGGSAITVNLEDPNKVTIGPQGVQVIGRIIFPPHLEFSLLGVMAEVDDLSAEYNSERSTLRIRGKVTLPEIAKQFSDIVARAGFPLSFKGKVAADFSGEENFIEVRSVSGGTRIDFVGAITVEDIVLIDGRLGVTPSVLFAIKEAKLSYNTITDEIRGEAEIVLPRFAPVSIIGGLGFRQGQLNFISLGVDNINKPLPFLGLFLQKVQGQIDQLANPMAGTLEFAGTLGFTEGPALDATYLIPSQVAEIFDIEPPVVGAGLRFDVTGRYAPSSLLSGAVKLTIVHKDVLTVTGEIVADFKNQNIRFIGSASLLKELLTGTATITTDLNSTTGTLAGRLKIPNVKFFGGLRNRELGTGQGYFTITPDGNSSNDFAYAYTTLTLPVLGRTTVGVRLVFDGSLPVVSTSLIELRRGRSFASSFAREADPGLGQSDAASGFARASSSSPSFNVEAGTEQLLLAASWENDVGLVPVEIVAPDGTVFTEADFDPARMAVIEEFSGPTDRAVAVLDPEPGLWTIRIANSDALGAVEFQAFRNSIEPTIDVTAALSTAAGSTINYTAADADSDARVSFFYDTDVEGFDGTLIGDGTVESDGAATTPWDTTDVPDGTYFIYAMIDDGNNAPVLDYLDQPVTVDHTPPTVTNVELLPDAARKKLAAFAVTFSEDMAAAGVSSAENANALANFKIQTAGRDKRLGTADDVSAPIRSVTYDAATRTARITPNVSLALNQFYQFSVLATATLTDAAGNSLDGDTNGTPGGNFVTVAGLGTRFKYTDRDNDSVSITLAGGGIIQLTRDATGEGLDLHVSGATNSSVLTGTVKRPRTGANPQSGTTTHRSITGVSAEQIRLANPPFVRPASFAAVIDEVLASFL